MVAGALALEPILGTLLTWLILGKSLSLQALVCYLNNSGDGGLQQEALASLWFWLNFLCFFSLSSQFPKPLLFLDCTWLNWNKSHFTGKPACLVCSSRQSFSCLGISTDPLNGHTSYLVPQSVGYVYVSFSRLDWVQLFLSSCLS